MQRGSFCAWKHMLEIRQRYWTAALDASLRHQERLLRDCFSSWAAECQQARKAEAAAMALSGKLPARTKVCSMHSEGLSL